MESTVQISFNLQFGVKHDNEAGVYVGYCPLLKLYSQGRDEKEAEDAVFSAATLFISTCYDRDILHNVLRDRGLKKSTHEPHDETRQYIAITGFDRTIERAVPLDLMSQVPDEVEAFCQ